MAVERHLILQELTLRPSGEWTPQVRGWLVARVAEGVGYWLNDGAARELKVGDGFVVGGNVRVLLRSSQLGSLKLQYFSVHPQYLNGLLSVAEWHQLEAASAAPAKSVALFSAGEPVAQKFSRIVELPHDHELSLRCALLQLWSGALHGLLNTPAVELNTGNKLHERLREVVGKMTEAELADTSLADLAGQLHCSERHFSRLFREEFGVPLRIPTPKSSTWLTTAATGTSACSTRCSKSVSASRPANGGSPAMAARPKILPCHREIIRRGRRR
jgi:AraC-like DNA-binding protein